MGSGDEAYRTERRCRHPSVQILGSMASPAMLPFFIGVWRDESPEPLDARYLSRQPFRETFERGCSFDLRVSTTGLSEEYNNSARAAILYSRFIAVPP